ncbi:hypothetical protein PIB30_022822 [Stylosanthes scabra]|uniref:Uncharacterized protein n=1 Tax=Stylosanthes scabra TaxID=79078 RepID=A0ABU6V960_9FABA|nr:hypothetical protein [Stylosanthes scabra]
MMNKASSCSFVLFLVATVFFSLASIGHAQQNNSPLAVEVNGTLLKQVLGIITGLSGANVTLSCLEGGVNVSVVAANATNGQGNFTITAGLSLGQLLTVLTGGCHVSAHVPLPVLRSISASLISVPPATQNIQANVTITDVVVSGNVATFNANIGPVMVN